MKYSTFAYLEVNASYSRIRQFSSKKNMKSHENAYMHDNANSETVDEGYERSNSGKMVRESSLQSKEEQNEQGRFENNWNLAVLFAASLLLASSEIGIAIVSVQMVVWLQLYPGERQVIMFAGSLMICCYCCVGPLANFLVTRWGSMWTSIAGSMMLAVGLVSSAYSPGSYFLVLTFGIIAAFTLGAAWGIRLSVMSVSISEIFGLADLSAIFSILSLSSGIGYGISLPIAGWIFTATGSYAWCWYISGTLLVVGIVTNCVVFIPTDSAREYKPTNSSHSVTDNFRV